MGVPVLVGDQKRDSERAPREPREFGDEGMVDAESRVVVLTLFLLPLLFTQDDD